MKKTFIFVIVIIAIGIGYWLISPLFINKKVSDISPLLENSEVENLPQTIAEGSFSGFDKTHYGSGTALIIKTDEGYVLRFEDNFNVANGPDLYVGFGKDGSYIKGSELSKLKGNIGSQNYVLPQDFDITKTNEVWIWCKAFAVPFAKAPLGQ
jgi:hypothetical protein